MDAVILAGGFGTRLQEVVPDLPKPMAHINGVPFLDLLLTQLASFGEVTRVILAVGYKATTIRSYYEKKSLPLPLYFSVETTPLGTGGALRRALKQVQTKDVLVLNGDSYLEFSLTGLQKQHALTQADATLACRHVPDASRFGQLSLDETQRIIAFREKIAKAQEGWINGGVYLIRQDFLNDFAEDVPLSLEKECFPSLLRKRVFGYPCDGLFIDIGTKESFFEAQKVLKVLCHVS